MLAVASALLITAFAPPEPFVSAGPAEGSSQTKSSETFAFRVPNREYSFECKLGDSRLRRFEPCVSPHTVTGLTPGAQTFQVRATNGTEIGIPAIRTWTISAIDDDADGHALPADCADTDPQVHPGAVEIPSNGIDEDCSGSDFAPPAALPASPTPTPTPTPVPTPKAKAKAKIAITLSYFMSAGKRATTFSTLSVKGVPKGATVKVTCAGGCPRRSQTLKRSGTVALTGYRRKAIRAGAKLTIAVTKPGMTGTAKVVKVRSNKRPTIVTKTLE